MDIITLIAQVVSISRTRLVLFSILFWGAFLNSCENKIEEYSDNKIEANVVLHTDLGSIYVKLLDETPHHKANFIRLVEQKFFDNLSFHRIIFEFMIQSGDPRYIDGGIDTTQESGPGYSLDKEIKEQLVHTRGMIGAAREPDEENPEQKSAGSQFYIVTGKPLRAADFAPFEMVGTTFRRGIMFKSYTQSKNPGTYQGTFQDYLAKNNFKPFKYPLKQKQKYMRDGGSPHLDFSYTIFGEVVSGMDIAMAISKIPTNSYQQPLDTIRILSAELLKK